MPVGTPVNTPDAWGSWMPGGQSSWGGATPWANAPQAVQDWFAQNWPGARGRTPPPGMPPRLPFTGWTRNPGGTVTSPGVAGPTLAGRQPLPVSNVGGNSGDGGDLLTPNTGVGRAPVPMPGGGPGGLLGSCWILRSMRT